MKKVQDKQLDINMKFNKQLNQNRTTAELYKTLRNKVDVKLFDESEGLSLPKAAQELFNSKL